MFSGLVDWEKNYLYKSLVKCCSAQEGIYVYQEDLMIRKLMDEFIGVRIKKGRVPFFRKLQEIEHKNVIGIRDVIEFEEPSDEALVLYVKPSCRFIDMKKWLQFGHGKRFESFNLRYFVSSLFDGMSALHANGLCHGELSLSNIYIHYLNEKDIGYDNFDYVIGDFNSQMNVGTPEGDSSLVGCLLEEFLRAEFGSHYSSQNEFLHLCQLFKSEYSLGIVSKPNVFTHPSLVSHFDHPTFVILAWVYLDGLLTDEEKYAIRGIVSDDKWFENIGSSRLKSHLIEKGAALFRKDADLVDTSDWSFFTMLKCCLLNYRENVPYFSQIEVAIDNEKNPERMLTAISVLRYFRNQQPNLMIRLYELAMSKGFKFHSPEQTEELKDYDLIE